MAAQQKTAKIKWGSETHVVNYDEETDFEMFQALIYSRTSVPPEKQKLMFKSKLLTNDEQFAKVQLKKTARIKLIGTATILNQPVQTTVIFEEDMSKFERAQLVAAVPPGLGNLGNTCYLNATVQCLKAIPELNDSLVNFGTASLNPSVSKSLGGLFANMNTTEESFPPYGFVNIFRQAFPMFASQGPRGGFQQQDADEFLTELLNTVGREVEVNGSNLNSQLFQGRFQVKEKCLESDENSVSTEVFSKLTCFIDKDISHILFGLKKGLMSQKEKRSTALGRNATYETTMEVIDLPQYLIVQKSRFSWKSIPSHENGGVNCKILKKVAFPLKLDVQMLCAPELRDRIVNYRTSLLEWKDEQRERRQNEGLDIEAIRAEMAKTGKPKAEAEEAAPVVEEEPTPAVEDDVEMAEEAATEPVVPLVTAEEMEIERAQAPVVENNTMAMEVVEEEVVAPKKKAIKNETGEYELIGVVTHKGRSANSGHYIGYAKDFKSGKWMKFDDDYVEEMKPEQIQTLYGGGDFQMGYLCFYQKIEPEEMTD